MDRINGADTHNIGQGRRGFKDENVVAGTAGTEVTAAFLNSLQEEILKVITESGLVPDPNDWTQLFQAITNMIASALNNLDTDRFLESVGAYNPDTNILVLNMSDDTELEIDMTLLFKDYTDNNLSAFLKNNQAFPEVLTPNNTLSITDNANGTLTIDAGQEWLWRGLFKLSTDGFSLADRTFSTVASKTYHLRWNATGTGNATPAETYPSGRFELADMDGLTETETQYDSTFDRMLIAKVVTDSVNTATITPLVNLAKISDLMFFDGGPNQSSGNNQALLTVDFILNLARTPKLTAIPSRISISQSSVVDRDRAFDVLSKSRYGGTLYVLFDYAAVIEAYVNVEE